MTDKSLNLLPALRQSVEELSSEYSQISDHRKVLLEELSGFVEHKIRSGQKAFLNFICTHNSRRSHLSQLWAQTAAYFYRVPNVVCLSGGTEATAFHPRAIKAMQDVGFNIQMIKAGGNPVYEVRFSDECDPVIAFSKKYDDPFNYFTEFAAVMTCAQADENCPVVIGATKRIALVYEDPKDFDDTSLERAKYAERTRQIGREMLYAFSRVNV